MRYESRTAKAIELLGGRKALMETMAAKNFCNDPGHTIECWMCRRQISRSGIDFIWRLALTKQIAICPDDLEVMDVIQEQDEAA